MGVTKTTVFVGLDEAFTYLGRKSGQKNKATPGIVARGLYPLSILAAFLLGLAAQFAARLIAFHVNIIPDATENPDFLLLSTTAMGLVIALTLGQLGRLNTRAQMVANAAGVGASVLGFHNLVHAAPQPFDLLFSPAWVAGMLQQTEAHSLFWRGVTLTF